MKTLVVDKFLGFVLGTDSILREILLARGLPEAGRRQVKIIIDHSIAAIDEYVTGEGAAAGKVMDG